MSRARIRRLPSPAMAVAVTALFVALGGTGYAAFALAPGSVGTAQLKNRAVTAAKVAFHTLTGNQIDLSATGFAAGGKPDEWWFETFNHDTSAADNIVAWAICVPARSWQDF